MNTIFPKMRKNFFKTLIVGIVLVVGCSRVDRLEECKQLIYQFDYDKARDALKRIISSDTTDTDAIALMLRSYFLSNDTNAFEALRTKLELSNPPIAKLSLGKFYFDVGQFVKADSEFTRVASFKNHLKEAAHWTHLTRRGIEAKQLEDSATIYLDQAKFDSAIVFYNHADAIWLELHHNHARTNTLANRSFALGYLGDIEGAERAALESYKISQQTGSRKLQAIALRVLGIIEDRKGNYRKAIEHFQRGKSLAKEDGHRSVDIEIRIATNMASAQVEVGEIQSANETYIEVLKKSKELKLDRIRCITLIKLAQLCRDLGQYDEANIYYDKSIRLAVQLKDQHLQAVSLASKGSIYALCGDYEKALEFYLTSNKIFKELDIQDSGNTIAMAQTYTYLGQYDDAHKIAQEALDAGEQSNAQDVVLRAEYVIAQNYEAQRDYPTAIGFYEKVLTRAQELQIFDLVISSITSLEKCYYESKVVPTSTTRLEKVISEAEKQHFTYIVESARLALARILIDKKEFSRALQMLDDILASAKAIGVFDLVGTAFEAKADAYRELKRNGDAQSAYTQAADAYEQIVSGISVGHNRASYFDRMRRLMEKQLHIAYDLGQFTKIFELAEKGKARTFLGLLSRREFTITSSSDSAVLAQEQALRRSVTHINSQFSDNLFNASNEAVSSPKLSKDLKTAHAEYSRFLVDLANKNPRIGSMVTASTVRIEDIHPLIPQKSLLLQYVVLDERLLICALLPQNQLRVFAVPYSRQNLRDDVNLLREQMQKKRLKETTWRNLASHLRHALLDSVEAAGLLASTEKLIILPDDVLHYLPFQMLLDDHGFLAERFAVVNYPSASVMKLLLAQKTSTLHGTVLAMGYSDGSIPFAEAEVKTIKKIVGSPAFALTGKAATKDSLFELANKYGVIHLAAHGISSAHDPMLFAIQLASTNSDDGKLFVHEVFNLSLRNAMVVLSGCETGVEKRLQRGISAGGEVIGLVRAFLFAGASSVVSTLWKVDDEASADFMRMFYDELQRTPDADVCLQKVQQRMIASSRFNHPYFWASYVSTGW